MFREAGQVLGFARVSVQKGIEEGLLGTGGGRVAVRGREAGTCGREGEVEGTREGQRVRAGAGERVFRGVEGLRGRGEARGVVFGPEKPYSGVRLLLSRVQLRGLPVRDSALDEMLVRGEETGRGAGPGRGFLS